MASARPVVSTKIAGVPEQIVHGETGFICKPGDVAELADSLEKLLRSHELREQFGAAGMRRERQLARPAMTTYHTNRISSMGDPYEDDH